MEVVLSVPLFLLTDWTQSLQWFPWNLVTVFLFFRSDYLQRGTEQERFVQRRIGRLNTDEVPERPNDFSVVSTTQK